MDSQIPMDSNTVFSSIPDNLSPVLFPIDQSLKSNLLPFHSVPFEEPSSTCYFRGYPTLLPIKMDLADDIPLLPVDERLEVSDLKIDENLPLFPILLPGAIRSRSVSPSLLDILDTISPPSNKAFPEQNILPELNNLKLSDSPAKCNFGINRPPTPRPSRRRTGLRAMSSEQRNQMENLLGSKRPRFFSGSQRNDLARKIGVPASQLFEAFGRKLDI